jgi:hypothetical protein
MKSLQSFVDKHRFLGVMFEQNIYHMARHYSENYDGGSWNSKNIVEDDVELDGFYLELDVPKEYKIRNSANFAHSQIEVSMNSKTFSYTIFTFLCNILGNKFYEDGHNEAADDLFELFYFARNNAEKVLLDEEERKKFFAFID